MLERGDCMWECIQGRSILFITTKNLDYLRNVQELKILKKRASHVKVIGSMHQSYCIRLIQVYFRLLFLNVDKFDVVFVGFAPQLIIPFFLYKWRRVYLIEDFFISLYDTFVHDRQIIRDGGILSVWLRKLDRCTMERGDFILSDTMAHGDYFAKEFGIDRRKIHTLYLEADGKVYRPRKQSYIKSETDPFVVLYFGSMLPLQGADVVLEAAKRLRGEKRLVFWIIGPVKKADKVVSANIEYIPWLSQKELARRIANADLCLAGHFHASIEKARRTIPGKALIYQKMKKPMILGENAANRELFQECAGRIYFVEMGSPKRLAEKILEARKQMEDLRQQKEKEYNHDT